MGTRAPFSRHRFHPGKWLARGVEVDKNMTVLDILKHWFSLLTEVGLSGLLDIGIVTLAIYIFLVAIKRTRRSGLILTGILIVGLVYLAARRLNLLLTVALLQGFFAVFLVALIVIFQEDLRYFFERVASLWLERGLPLYRRKRGRLSPPGSGNPDPVAERPGPGQNRGPGGHPGERPDRPALGGRRGGPGVALRSPAEKHFRSPFFRP